MSGMETFILTPGEGARLDGFVAGLGRLAMKGSACCKLEEGKHKAVPNAGVFAHWRIASIAVELKPRRLGMMQEWARDLERTTSKSSLLSSEKCGGKERTHTVGFHNFDRRIFSLRASNQK